MYSKSCYQSQRTGLSIVLVVLPNLFYALGESKIFVRLGLQVSVK